MNGVSAPPHITAANPLLVSIGCFGTLIAMTLVAGGLYLAFADKFSNTQFELFGNEFASTSVGVSMAFMGAVVTIIVFRSIVEAVKYLAKLP